MTEDSPVIAPMRTKAKVPLAPVRIPMLQSIWTWFWGISFLLCTPLVIPYLLDLWQLEHYRYFPFAIAAVVYWTRKRMLLPVYGPRGYFAGVLLVSSFALLLLAMRAQSAWFGIVAFVLCAASFLRSQCGRNDWSLLGLVAPLLLLIRLPVGLDQLLIIRLQHVTSRLSSVVLDLCRIPHSMQGNVIRLPEKELFVAEACSGIQSVFTLMFVASLLIAWKRRSLWLTPLYFATATFIALASNVMRISIIALAQYTLDADLSSGLAHEVVGYMALGIASLILLSFDSLISAALHPISFFTKDLSGNPVIWLWNRLIDPHSISEVVYGERTSQLSRDAQPLFQLTFLQRNRWASWSTGIVAITLFLSASIQAAKMDVRVPMSQLLQSEVIFQPGKDLLGEHFGPLIVTDHEMSREGSNARLGENSDIWTCQTADRVGQFVVSQTYSGWHELCVCYEGLAWQLIDRDVVTASELLDTKMDFEDEPENIDDSFVSAQFKASDGTFGYLLFGAINADGSLHPAPSTFGAFGSRLFGRLDRFGVIEQEDLLMVQFWMVTDQELDKDFDRELQRAFLTARSNVAEKIRESTEYSDTVNLTSMESH